MPRLIEYVTVGICSGYLDGDYAVSAKVADLSPEDMRELRLAMIGAIACMEQMWRAEQEKKFPPGQVAILSSGGGVG